MSTVQEIKQAASRLSAKERLELSEWLGQAQDVERLRLEELRRNIAIGIAQADRGELRDSDEVFRKLKQGR